MAATRQDLERRRRAVPEAELEQRAAQRRASEGGRRFEEALAGAGLALIAEHKRRSPSAGAIRNGVPLQEIVSAYERGGAAALSILTEGPSFGGSLEDLRAARAASRLPILRKDFLVERYQLLESLLAGADAVLLIVAAVSEGELSRLHSEALALGLSALVEVHDARELEVALSAGTRLLGINNRDLTTLEVDTGRTFELVPHAPEGVTVVAESGLRERAELERLAEAGVDAVLVGEALMRSPDIEAACRALVAR